MRLRALAFAHRLPILPDVLVALARQLHALELQVPVVETPDDLPLSDRIAGAQQGVFHVAVDGRGDGALDRSLQRRIGGDAEIASRESEERGDDDDGHSTELQRRVPRARQSHPNIFDRPAGVRREARFVHIA